MSERFHSPGEPIRPIDAHLGVPLTHILDSEVTQSPEAQRPDYAARVVILEEMAEGHGVAMRCGIEAEVMLLAPAGFREYMAADTTRSYVERVERSKIRNPKLIEEGEVIDDSAKQLVLSDFRQEARGLVAGLVPQNDEEAARQTEWLGQIDSFGLRELINFRMYKEFSRPALAIARPPEDATLAGIDAYSDASGWLEFRFGTGKFQSGYYDNDYVSEIRLSPCPPSEAVRREAIILNRMTEVASEYGVLLSMRKEHINLSIYEADEAGEMVPVIGHSDARRKRTLDIAAGIGAAFQEGVWLNYGEMQFDHNFGQYSKVRFDMGPTRKTVRVMEGRLELRDRFEAADQGLTWLMAGALYGGVKGQAAIEAEGFVVPGEKRIFRVHGGSEYDKSTDVHIKRAFEHAEQRADGGFDLNEGYLITRGKAVRHALFGDEYGQVSLINIAFQAAHLNEEGVPQVTVEGLQSAYEAQPDFLKENYLGAFPEIDLEQLAQKLNSRLDRIRLESVTAILGESRFVQPDRETALEALRASELARLTYGDQLGTLTGWLGSAEPVDPRV